MGHPLQFVRALASIQELPDVQPCDASVQRRRLVDVDRRLAPKLERARGQVPCCRLEHNPAHRSVPGVQDVVPFLPKQRRGLRHSPKLNLDAIRIKVFRDQLRQHLRNRR